MEIGYFGFSDGGCINNGKNNAKASFCSIIIDGKQKHIIDGLVKPNKYNINDSNFKYDEDNKLISIGDTLNDLLLIDDNIKIVPSNNRGELLGLINCFSQLLFMGLNEDMSNNFIEIYTDSLLCINTFNIWLPNRQKKNTINKLKNLDLLTIGDFLFTQLKQKYKSVKLLHVNSHQPRPAQNKGTKALFIWLGNNLADQHCSECLT